MAMYSRWWAVLLFCFASCSGPGGNNPEPETASLIPVDTLVYVALPAPIYHPNTYAVLHLVNLNSDGRPAPKSARLAIMENDALLTQVPLPDSVQSHIFYIRQLMPSDSGFSFTAEWGDSVDMYSRKFFFRYRNYQFFCDSTQDSHFQNGRPAGGVSAEAVNPPVAIQAFDIKNYLQKSTADSTQKGRTGGE